MSHQPIQNVTAGTDAAAARPADEKAKKSSRLKRFVVWLLGVAVLLVLPTRPPNVHAQSGNCGPFTDVTASSGTCPFILEAFNLGITNGTSATTFSPSLDVSRDQMVTFFDRGVDFAVHRGRKMAIGRTWAPTSSAGGVSVDVGGASLDIVTDGMFLWIARNDGAILKVTAADRTLQQTWHITAGAVPAKLGVFAGLVWIADQQGNLYFLDPSQTPGTRSVFVAGASGGGPTMAFDGTNVWLGGSFGTTYFKYQVGSPNNFSFTAPANVYGFAFDGTFMWMLLSNGHLQKLNLTAQGVAPTVAEDIDIALPGIVGDCKMVFDGNNLWIPRGPLGGRARGSADSRFVSQRGRPEPGYCRRQLPVCCLVRRREHHGRRWRQRTSQPLQGHQSHFYRFVP